MTQRFMIFAAAGVSALALATGAAMAQPEGPGRMFEQADTNGDGVITAGEREAAQAEMFAKLDADANGFVSEDELKAAHEARRETMRERMKERRAEWREKRKEMGGERLHKEHGDRPHREGRHRERGNPMMGLDTNEDGLISQAEFLAAEAPHLDKIDANGDGDITRAEAEAAREAMRDSMKERRKAWREKKQDVQDTE